MPLDGCLGPGLRIHPHVMISTGPHKAATMIEQVFFEFATFHLVNSITIKHKA